MPALWIWCHRRRIHRSEGHSVCGPRGDVLAADPARHSASPRWQDFFRRRRIQAGSFDAGTTLAAPAAWGCDASCDCTILSASLPRPARPVRHRLEQSRSQRRADGRPDRCGWLDDFCRRPGAADRGRRLRQRDYGADKVGTIDPTKLIDEQRSWDEQADEDILVPAGHRRVSAGLLLFADRGQQLQDHACPR